MIMIYIFLVVIIYIFYIIKQIIETYDIDTFNLINLFNKRNTFATFKVGIHYKMMNILYKYIYNLKKRINILEIGAGDGRSSKRFLTYLRLYTNCKYNYDINEYYEEYKQEIENNTKDENVNNIHLMPFESIYMKDEKKYDVILLTASSALNKDNIVYLKKISHRNTLFITINKTPSFISKYFIIVEQHNCSFFLKLYCCVLK